VILYSHAWKDDTNKTSSSQLCLDSTKTERKSSVASSILS